MNKKQKTEKSVHGQKQGIFCLKNRVGGRALQIKSRIPCIGPTMQASGWDVGHMGESGDKDIILSAL